MKRRNRKLTTLAITLLTLIATFGTLGYAYACRTPRRNWCNYEVVFTEVTWSDNEIEKDVADVWATITNCASKIEIYITNAYPCYTAYVNFTIKNKGCKSVHIDEVSVENLNPTELEVMTTNLECIWIDPCGKVKGQVAAHLLQPAKENWSYQFEISIHLSVCPRVHPRTIGFWKHQFKVALGWGGTAQVDPDTLEDYLDEITDESNVFSFTGTREQKFQEALDILRISFHSSMEAKLRAQLLALWLNYVAGWTNGYRIEGLTAWEIIEGSEEALINGHTGEYEDWKNLCDRFNNIGG